MTNYLDYEEDIPGWVDVDWMNWFAITRYSDDDDDDDDGGGGLGCGSVSYVSRTPSDFGMRRRSGLAHENHRQRLLGGIRKGTVDEGGSTFGRTAAGHDDPTLCPPTIAGEPPSATLDHNCDSHDKVEMWRTATLLSVGSPAVAAGCTEPQRLRRRKRPRISTQDRRKARTFREKSLALSSQGDDHWASISSICLGIKF